MHDEVRGWVWQHLPHEAVRVLEFGSQDMNGSVRDLSFGDEWVGVDIVAGPGVDIVADGCTYRHPTPVDMVVCCEVLEHLETWPELVANAAANLRPGGLFVGTCAGPGRSPHSGIRAEPGMVDGEFYANVAQDQFESVASAHFSSVHAQLRGTDLQWRCIK
jgi:SAM-dependent methyltransferase